MTTVNYLVKALESYPYYMEECIESLNYALSYDAENAIALCLMGRIQADVFGNVPSAIDYFENALASDMSYAETYRHYMNVLIENEQLEKARAFLVFSQKRIAHQKARLLVFEARILEREHKWKKALKVLETALENAYSEEVIEEIDQLKRRIERKLEC